MSNLRKLIAKMDALNEGAVSPKKTVAEGSMLKALNMITKPVGPAIAMAKEFKQFIDHGKHSPEKQRISESTQLYTTESMGDKIHQDTGLPLNSDGTVTLYHHTSAEKAAQIRKSGMIKSAAEPDVYMTTRKETDTGYGDTALPVRVDPRKLQIDDEFPDGRKDFRIDTGKPGGQVKVRIGESVRRRATEGTPEGLPHITKELLAHIVDQIGKEGAHAIIKSLEWGDGAAEELLQLIKKDLEKHVSLRESVKQRLDKSCWAGYRKSGTKMKGGVRVNNCVKENKYGVYSIFKESTGPIKTFALKEQAMAVAKYYNKNIPHAERLQYGNQYVVRNVYEAMPPAVATASVKMNPASKMPTPAINAPAAPSALTSAPSSKVAAPAQVDPKVAQAKQQAKQAAIQAGINKLQLPDTNKSADMNMPPTADDTANNTKIATKIAPAVADVLMNPEGADEINALIKKYGTPGQQ